MDKLSLKMARDKYGRIYLQSKSKKKTAEEILSVSLSILHDSYRNEEWAIKIKNLIRLTDGGIDLSL
jgi:hypothetical protein